VKPTVSIDMTEFNAAMKQLLATTSRTLPEFLNSRLFFWLLRIYAALDPKSPQSERNRIRAYLNEPIGERRFDKRTGKKVGRGRMLQRRHLIVQAKNSKAGNKGLYGEEMKKAAGAFSRKAIGSVGYLKAAVAKSIKAINGHFSQFGYTTKKSGGKQVPGNAALIAIANQYGLKAENVAMHKGARGYAYPAKDGFNPYSIADMAVAIADDQVGRVSERYSVAGQRATNDETVEMQKHLARHMQGICNEHMEKPL